MELQVVGQVARQEVRDQALQTIIKEREMALLNSKAAQEQEGMIMMMKENGEDSQE
jgi:hypothetical protein